METVSLTVPLEEAPLRRAAAMLTGLAEDIRDGGYKHVTEFSDKVVNSVAKNVEVSAEDLKKAPGDTLTAEEISEGDAQLGATLEEFEGECDIAIPGAVDPAVVFGSAPAEVSAPIVEAVSPAVDLDGEVLPWDGRIHTDTKTRRQSDNTWKLKRGADPAFVEQVKAELKATMSAPASVVVVAPATVVTPDTVTTFAELVVYVTGKCNSGAVQMLQIEELLATHGIVGGLPLVGARPDLIPAIYADMVKLWPDTQG